MTATWQHVDALGLNIHLGVSSLWLFLLLDAECSFLVWRCPAHPTSGIVLHYMAGMFAGHAWVDGGKKKSWCESQC